MMNNGRLFFTFSLALFLLIFFFPSWQFEKDPILPPLHLRFTSHHVPEGLFLFTPKNGFPSLFLSYLSLTHCGVESQRRDISWHRDPAVNLSTVDPALFDSSKCCVNALSANTFIKVFVKLYSLTMRWTSGHVGMCLRSWVVFLSFCVKMKGAISAFLTGI